MSKTIDVEAGDTFYESDVMLQERCRSGSRAVYWNAPGSWRNRAIDNVLPVVPRDRALAALRAMGYEVVAKEPDLPRVRVTHGVRWPDGTVVPFDGNKEQCEHYAATRGGRPVALDFGGDFGGGQ